MRSLASRSFDCCQQIEVENGSSVPVISPVMNIAAFPKANFEVRLANNLLI